MVINKKMTGDEFAAKARALHGDKYQYDRVNYKNNKTTVEIVCPLHGIFLQAPTNHLRGKRCRKCASQSLGAAFRKTTDDFLVQARKLHGDRFDYSKVKYKQAHERVKIICRAHGSFLQTPTSHLSGAGCKKCANEESGDRMRFTSQKFIALAKKRFGLRFDYSHVDYKAALAPVKIICPLHGAFRQTPSFHLNSIHGCPKCSRQQVNRNRRLTQAEFLRRANLVHGNQYDYSLSKIIDGKRAATIICSKHGEFHQSPEGHLLGKGCKKCGNLQISLTQRQTLSAFIKRARGKHGEKYDYSLTEYTTARKKVKITCPVHGVFEQVPDMHLRSGCRKCADDDLPGAYSLKVLARNPVLASQQSVLYYVSFKSHSGERFYKVGVTRISVKKRFSGYAAAGYQITSIKEKKMQLLAAYKAEQSLLKKHGKDFRYRPLRGNRQGFKFGGGSECFSKPLSNELLIIFN